MLVEHLPTVVPSSLLGKALQYVSGQWRRLAVSGTAFQFPQSGGLMVVS
jgi:hypothetical protein